MFHWGPGTDPKDYLQAANFLLLRSDSEAIGLHMRDSNPHLPNRSGQFTNAPLSDPAFGAWRSKSQRVRYFTTNFHWRLNHWLITWCQPQGNIYGDAPWVNNSGYQEASFMVKEHPDITQFAQCSFTHGSPSFEIMNSAEVNVPSHPGFILAMSGLPSHSDTGQSHRRTDSVTLEPVSTSECTRNGKKYYICGCGHETRSMGDMSRHHESRKHSFPKYSCLCGKKFTRKDGRTRHEKKCKRKSTSVALV